jgi:hypothetical protein
MATHRNETRRYRLRPLEDDLPPGRHGKAEHPHGPRVVRGHARAVVCTVRRGVFCGRGGGEWRNSRLGGKVGVRSERRWNGEVFPARGLAWLEPGWRRDAGIRL